MTYVYVYLGIQLVGFLAVAGTFLVLARRDKPSVARVAIHLLPALMIALVPYLLFMGPIKQLVWLAGVAGQGLVIALDPPLRRASAISSAPLLFLAAWSGFALVGMGGI